MKYICSIFLLLLFSVSVFAQKGNVEIVSLDINSSYDDFSPTLTKFGRMMYFTSEMDGDGQKIFEAERSPDGWVVNDKIDGIVNDAMNNGAVAITPDGQYMIFAAYDHDISGEGRTDLYSARKVYGAWTDVQNLGPNVNSGDWDSQPTLSSNGMVLLFSSDRPGGQGGTDIYISTRDANGRWSKARNLGSGINSGVDEMSPVIMTDNKSMSFSSNRSGSYGGFDIYVANFNGANVSNVRNIGMPINSTADEHFYNNVPNSAIAYFSSDRNAGKGGFDVYMAIEYDDDGTPKKSFDLNDSELEISAYNEEAVYENFDLTSLSSGPVVLVEGYVYDKETKEPVGADIIVTDLRTQKKYAQFRSDDETGEYYVALVPGRDYSITAEKDGYLFLSEKYEISGSNTAGAENKDYYLLPIEGGSTRLLIFFDFDKTNIKDESIPELERVIKFLRDNEDVRIVIEGHTDDVGSDEYNDKLSLERANSVKSYIVSAGVSASRISTEGHGKRKPLVAKKTDEARAVNRRVEMRLL